MATGLRSTWEAATQTYDLCGNPLITIGYEGHSDALEIYNFQKSKWNSQETANGEQQTKESVCLFVFNHNIVFTQYMHQAQTVCTHLFSSFLSSFYLYAL